jgi:hypothetical protein
MFSASDYDRLSALCFAPGSPYDRTPHTELPNGDGKADVGKRYAHIAPKYLDKDSNPQRRAELEQVLLRAFELSLQVAAKLGSPPPQLESCALRILHYPADVGSNRHTDFDLFTLPLFRNVWPPFVCEGAPLPRKIRKLCTRAHLGELGELLGLGPAAPHYVLPYSGEQKSIVFFALPDPELKLPDGRTAGDWLAERYSRSRA